jgi:NAD(P)-dependent dehydrogenase (short-subunit alcohol dehydrogenase family)
MAWTATDISDQTGRVHVVTGANGDIGAEITTALAAAGATVVMACRNVRSAQEIADRVDGDVRVAELDLADLGSVRSFADSLDAVDVLVNNAGLLSVPLSRTGAGVESQLGVNHLGHFALTGLLLERLRDRVVTVSSVAHRSAKGLDLDDVDFSRRPYDKQLAYQQSKLANLLFARELQRKLERADAPQRSYAAHPGVTVTGAPAVESFGDRVAGVFMKTFGQQPVQAATSVLYAATEPDADPATYWGPTGFLGVRGPVGAAKSSKLSQDTALAAELWRRSEELTGVTFPF